MEHEKTPLSKETLTMQYVWKAHNILMFYQTGARSQ